MQTNQNDIELLKEAVLLLDFQNVRKYFENHNTADVSKLIIRWGEQEVVMLFRLLSTKKSAELFTYLPPIYQKKIVEILTRKDIEKLLTDLYNDDIVDILEELPANLTKKILSYAPKEDRDVINKLLNFSEDSVGSIMSVDMIQLKNTDTVARAIKKIRDAANAIEITHYFYVVDKKHRLIGYLLSEDLILATNSTKITKIIRKDIISVNSLDDKEGAANAFKFYDMSVLPVVNKENCLIGMITSDDIIDVIEEEATEDIHKMAGINPSDKQYTEMNTMEIFRSRFFWLLLLMLSATLSQATLDYFQRWTNNITGVVGPTIMATTITATLVAIVPDLSGASGNAGSQSSTMVIRALAIGDINKTDYLRVFLKELKAGTLIGLALFVANFIRLLLYYTVRNGSLSNLDIWISLAASLSLWLVIILAKLVGGMLPLLASAINLDPAVMAAPLLTTLVDALSILLFFLISIGILKWSGEIPIHHSIKTLATVVLHIQI